jgi:hypothetical protein
MHVDEMLNVMSLHIRHIVIAYQTIKAIPLLNAFELYKSLMILKTHALHNLAEKTQNAQFIIMQQNVLVYHLTVEILIRQDVALNVFKMLIVRHNWLA